MESLTKLLESPSCCFFPSKASQKLTHVKAHLQEKFSLIVFESSLQKVFVNPNQVVSLILCFSLLFSLFFLCFFYHPLDRQDVCVDYWWSSNPHVPHHCGLSLFNGDILNFPPCILPILQPNWTGFLCCEGKMSVSVWEERRGGEDFGRSFVFFIWKWHVVNIYTLQV